MAMTQKDKWELCRILSPSGLALLAVAHGRMARMALRRNQTGHAFSYAKQAARFAAIYRMDQDTYAGSDTSNQKPIV